MLIEAINETDNNHAIHPSEKSGGTLLNKDEDIIDLGKDFRIDDYQVVRREFFANLREPAIVFNNCKLSVNSACLAKFPDQDSVQVLINKDTKVMALLPCEEGSKDSFVWCSVRRGKRIPKYVSCRLFFAKVVELMGWNPDYKYRILGKVVRADETTLIAFDLTATETYQRIYPDGKKPKISRTPVFPAEWQNQFGLPYNVHRKSMEIDIVEGYAVYSIKDIDNIQQPSMTISDSLDTNDKTETQTNE